MGSEGPTVTRASVTHAQRMRDGERSELRYDGDQGGLHVSKDKLSVRTPLGKFELNW